MYLVIRSKMPGVEDIYLVKFIDRDIFHVSVTFSCREVIVGLVNAKCQISRRLRQQIFPNPFLLFKQSCNLDLLYILNGNNDIPS